MSPPYLFQIDEIAEQTDAFYHADNQGNWKPSVDRGANVNHTGAGNISGRQWFCNGKQISEIAHRPHDAQLYKTYSVYYVGGVGFSILKGDARNPPEDDDWHPLQFSYYNNDDYSSYLTNAGQATTLRLQPQDRDWANLLLPTTNQTHIQATQTNYGGVVGELPILLALLAFTTSREYLPSVLPHLFRDETWVTKHAWQMQRIHQRGVVVTVYTCPKEYNPNARKGWTGSSARDLYDYEMGSYGKYFY